MPRMTPPDDVIDLRGIHKTYNRKIHALRGVDLKVRRGEIFGLLGPNGAGKSTLVKIMLTVVRPDRAAGTVLGEPVGHTATLRRIGYLPENLRFGDYLTGREVLDLCAALSLVPRHQRPRRIDQWLERVGMRDAADRRITEYSKGMMQRIGLAQALLHDPEVVVLDEPTDGVDPMGRRDIRHLLDELRRGGKTIFLNSHILSEVEMVCDRVAMIITGSVARQGPIDQLTAGHTTYRLTAAQSIEAHISDIRRCGGEVDGRSILLTSGDAHAVNRLIDLLRSRDVLIESVVPQRWSLEDAFIDAATQLPQQER